MCTLLIDGRSPDRLIVSMNRDESRQRSAEIAPKLYKNCIYPLDSQSSGTWIGVNRDNMHTACLLNRYDSIDYTPKASRGKLVPTVLSGQKLEGMDLQQYAPFNLLEILGNSIVSYKWDGKALKTSENPIKDVFFTSSSSWNEQEVLAWRQERFNNWLSQGGAYVKQFPSYNLYQEQGFAEYSPLVSRENTYTKSLTQFVLRADNKIDIAYIPEPKPIV